MGLYLEAMEIDNTNISKDGHLKLGQPVHISLKRAETRHKKVILKKKNKNDTKI